jgi:hypothetical protein
LANLKKGVYFFKIKTSEMSLTKKLIKL